MTGDFCNLKENIIFHLILGSVFSIYVVFNGLPSSLLRITDRSFVIIYRVFAIKFLCLFVKLMPFYLFLAHSSFAYHFVLC